METLRKKISNPLEEKFASSESEHIFSVEKVRQDFPILHTQVYGKPLIYLDNAATTQKPKAVINSLRKYYEHENANIHRGVYHLSEAATHHYETVRGKVKSFLNAETAQEIVFVRGTTEGINLVAASFGSRFIKKDDEIIISHMEHHSNIVPWQLLCERTGAKLRIIPINDDGDLDFEEYERLLGPRTKLVSLVHVSNSLGTINPVKEVVHRAHAVGAKVLIDGAQAVSHLPVDVQDLGCDFYAFSGHKLFGPTGIGVLYGRQELLEEMPPYQGGGDMIKSVTFAKTTFNDVPYKFEAGTPHIAGVIGLGAALDYFQGLDLAGLRKHESELLDYATKALVDIVGLRLIGNARKKASVMSFVLKDIHPHDIGTVLDQESICIRAGHHCTQPLMERFNVPATARASISFYNTKSEIDRLVQSILKVQEIFEQCPMFESSINK